ncbi:MAG: hypothetical protein MHM6MM_004415 [Cercozoa sp. M6MM]
MNAPNLSQQPKFAKRRTRSQILGEEIEPLRLDFESLSTDSCNPDTEKSELKQCGIVEDHALVIQLATFEVKRCHSRFFCWQSLFSSMRGRLPPKLRCAWASSMWYGALHVLTRKDSLTPIEEIEEAFEVVSQALQLLFMQCTRGDERRIRILDSFRQHEKILHIAKSQKLPPIAVFEHTRSETFVDASQCEHLLLQFPQLLGHLHSDFGAANHDASASILQASLKPKMTRLGTEYKCLLSLSTLVRTLAFHGGVIRAPCPRSQSNRLAFLLADSSIFPEVCLGHFVSLRTRNRIARALVDVWLSYGSPRLMWDIAASLKNIDPSKSCLSRTDETKVDVLAARRREVADIEQALRRSHDACRKKKVLQVKSLFSGKLGYKLHLDVLDNVLVGYCIGDEARHRGSDFQAALHRVARAFLPPLLLEE